MSELTNGASKSLLQIGGQTLLEHNIRALRSIDVEEIVIVRGDNHEIPVMGCRSVSGVSGGNMVSSLMLAAEYFDDDLLIAYADVLYDPEVLKIAGVAEGDFVVPVDLEWSRVFEHRERGIYSEAESCLYDDDHLLIEIGKIPATPVNTKAQFMGLLRISEAGLDKVSRMWFGVGVGKPLDRWISSTELLQSLIDSGEAVRALPLRGGWFEFDSPQDYRRALELQDEARFQFLRPIL